MSSNHYEIAKVENDRIQMTLRIKYFLTTATGILWFFAMSAQIPQGYYDKTQGMAGEELRQALHEVTKNHTRQSYNSIWNHFFRTDRKENGKVWDIYSDIPPPGTPPYEYEFSLNQCNSTPTEEGSCYNREHSFPKSWWGGGETAEDTMYTDLFQVIPVDGWVNNHRSNHPYGIVNGPATTMNGGKLGDNAFIFEGRLTGTVFEPIDAYKGDLARNYFYMMARYKTRVADWSNKTQMLENGDLAPWAVAMLLLWHVNDPVSQKEKDRNDSVFLIQENRNPFIDHPEFVALIWDYEVLPEPVHHVTGFGSQANSVSQISVTWNDAAPGSQAPLGYLIKAAIAPSMPEEPVDGVFEPAGLLVKRAGHGSGGRVVFDGLEAGTIYNFVIWPYTNSGFDVNYKTDGFVPIASARTYVVFYTENMGVPTDITGIGNYTGWEQGMPVVYSGNADVRSTMPSGGYEGATGAGNVYFTTSQGTYFMVEGINTSGYRDIRLNTGHYKNRIAASNELQIAVSKDGEVWQVLEYERATGIGTSIWIRIFPEGTIPPTENLRLLFTQQSGTAQFRIDDLQLTGLELAGEPLEHVTEFTAHTITLKWSDAVGSTLPDGYLIVMSDQGFDVIADPVDGLVLEDDFWNQSVGYGVEKAVFGGLTAGVVYYFKIFSYRLNEEGIVYKVGEGVPEIRKVAR